MSAAPARSEAHGEADCRRADCGFPCPAVKEEIAEVILSPSQKHTQHPIKEEPMCDRTEKQVADMPVFSIQNEVEVTTAIPHQHLSERLVERIVTVPVRETDHGHPCAAGRRGSRRRCAGRHSTRARTVVKKVGIFCAAYHKSGHICAADHQEHRGICAEHAATARTGSYGTPCVPDHRGNREGNAEHATRARTEADCAQILSEIEEVVQTVVPCTIERSSRSRSHLLSNLRRSSLG